AESFQIAGKLSLGYYFTRLRIAHVNQNARCARIASIEAVSRVAQSRNAERHDSYLLLRSVVHNERGLLASSATKLTGPGTVVNVATAEHKKVEVRLYPFHVVDARRPLHLKTRRVNAVGVGAS